MYPHQSHRVSFQIMGWTVGSIRKLAHPQKCKFKKLMKQGRSSLMQNLFHHLNILGIRTKQLTIKFPCRSSLVLRLSQVLISLAMMVIRVLISLQATLLTDCLSRHTRISLPLRTLLEKLGKSSVPLHHR